MNNNGMIRQYVAFAIVVLIAIFVFTQFDWSRLPAPGIIQTESDQRFQTVERGVVPDPEVSFQDLSAGGVTGATRQQTPETVFSPTEPITQLTVATSSPLTATSTPFQAGPQTQRAYEGVDVQFSNPN